MASKMYMIITPEDFNKVIQFTNELMIPFKDSPKASAVKNILDSTQMMSIDFVDAPANLGPEGKQIGNLPK